MKISRLLNALLTAISLLATTMPVLAATPGPFGQRAADYVITFAEEFDNGLSPLKWNDHIWYEDANPTINYSVEEGMLKIWPERDADGRFFNRTIDTDGHFSQTYGYFEIEAKLPTGKGVWPAFWLLNHSGATRPEIDVLEAYPGGGPTSGWSDSMLHPTTYAVTIWRDANLQAAFKKIPTGDLSAGFHKYAVKWDTNKITFYFDGKSVLAANVRLDVPMIMLLDLWFGSASGTPDVTTPTGKSNAFEIRYARAWRFK
jgi:beta-glucanase (GH16 family)